ncbi:MAG: AraC family transcriptional regulator [Kiritimatiellia bacterium]
MNIFTEKTGFWVDKIVYKKPTVFGPRVQTDWQLVFVQCGDAEVELEQGASCRLRAGEAVVLVPGHRETFHFAREGETRHGWLLARVPHQEAAPPEPPLLRVVPFPPVLRQVVEVMERLAGGGSELVHPLARQMADGLFQACLHPEWREAQRERVLHPAVEKVQGHMTEHFAEPLTLAALAREAGVSPTHLVRLFRRELGITPMRALRRQRLQRAEDLLVHSGWTVAEIAYRCGFADPQHFSRCFRAEHDPSPGRYRKQVWERGG